MLTFWVLILGCGDLDIRSASPNDCVGMYEHVQQVKNGSGLLKSAALAIAKSSGIQTEFVKQCSTSMTKRHVSCTLKQSSIIGVDACLKDVLPQGYNSWSSAPSSQ